MKTACMPVAGERKLYARFGRCVLRLCVQQPGLARVFLRLFVWPLASCATVFALLVAMVYDAVGCDDTVRGQAFVDPRDVHRLCVMATHDDSTSGETVARLEEWLSGSGAAMNIEVVQVTADDQSVEWESFGVPSAPPMLPVTVLVGRSNRDNRCFVIDHWEPAPAADDLAELLSSPVRDSIRRLSGKHWAILLMSPAQAADASVGLEVVRKVAAEWTEEHPPGVAVVQMDREDQNERTLLSFCGIDPAGPDWVGISFGRGKLMAPPLVGKEITAENLNELLNKLTEICSCLQPPRLLGVDMPLAWEPAMDEAVVSLLAPGTTSSITSASVAVEDMARPAGSPILATSATVLGIAALLVAVVTAALIRRPRGSTSKQG